MSSRPLEAAAASPALLCWLDAAKTHPRTKPLDFSACFGGNLSPEARALLNLATTQRNKMIDVLGEAGSKGEAVPDPRNISAAVEAYLPSLWTITASLEAAASLVIKLTSSKLEFRWTTTLMNKPKEYCFGVLIYECTFVLAIRALAHRQTAKIILQQNPSAYMEAGKELRKAAGIFELIATSLLPRWADPPASRPPEVWAPVASGLAAMCLADAQRLVACKSFTTGSPPSVVAKLLLGAADKYEFATRALQTLDKATFDGLADVIREELGALPAVLRATATNELAWAAHAKEEYGRASGFATDAVMRFGALTALGKDMVSQGLGTLVAEAKARAAKTAHEYANEVSSVYFVSVPKDLEWPEPTFIVTPIPYELPETTLVSFSELPLPPGVAKKSTRSFFASLFISPDFYTAEQLQARQAAPAGVDATVFDALPADIQQEVLADRMKETAL